MHQGRRDVVEYYVDKIVLIRHRWAGAACVVCKRSRDKDVRLEVDLRFEPDADGTHAFSGGGRARVVLQDCRPRATWVKWYPEGQRVAACDHVFGWRTKSCRRCGADLLDFINEGTATITLAIDDLPPLPRPSWMNGVCFTTNDVPSTRPRMP